MYIYSYIYIVTRTLLVFGLWYYTILYTPCQGQAPYAYNAATFACTEIG